MMMRSLVLALAMLAVLPFARAAEKPVVDHSAHKEWKALYTQHQADVTAFRKQIQADRKELEDGLKGQPASEAQAARAQFREGFKRRWQEFNKSWSQKLAAF